MVAGSVAIATKGAKSHVYVTSGNIFGNRHSLFTERAIDFLIMD